MNLVPGPEIDRALTLAHQALYLTSPNPRVGCVLQSSTGQILGEGHTQKAGGLHAEIMALQDALAKGHDVKGATAYVTLEPCSHRGRTGPCCDALVAAGIGKVVASIADPNPLVSGRGFERLRAAGVEVEVGPGAEQSRLLNIGFFSRMIRKAPWVRMKIAASIDGKTALENGSSQWITSEHARADGHSWRARSCAILTGIGTVLQDDPLLNVRFAQSTRQPHMVVVDSRLELLPTARLFQTDRKMYIYTTSEDPQKIQPLEARGAKVIVLPNGHGKVDLAAMMQDLAKHEINELHVEAGHKLNGSLLREDLVDEFLVYLAPKFVGEGMGMAHFGPLASLDHSLPLVFDSCERIGPDLRLLAHRHGRQSF